MDRHKHYACRRAHKRYERQLLEERDERRKMVNKANSRIRNHENGKAKVEKVEKRTERAGTRRTESRA